MTALERLKQRRQWVAWKYKTRAAGQKPTKPPVDPHTGKWAKVNDPTTWGTYDEAINRRDVDNLSGVGYVLTLADKMTGIDLDRVRDYTSGVLAPWAQEIVDFKETYCEVSPSGTGLRFFALHELEAAIKNDTQQVEIYGDVRFLTITGNKLEGCPDSINPAPRTLAALMARAAQGQGDIEVERGIREQHVEDEFDKLNTLGLQNLSSWVPDLFGAAAVVSSRGGYRVPSRALGRALDEDISITTAGIKDFGVHDMGDAKQGKRTPISLVMEHREMMFDDAVGWLCKCLGVQKPGMVLDPKAPMAIARTLLKARFTTDDGQFTLRRYREAFWIWRNGCYKNAQDETLQISLHRFLERVRKRGKNGPVPFDANNGVVANALGSLGAACALEEFAELPAWITLRDMPPATEFLACANGLLHVPTQNIYPPTPDYFCVSSTSVAYDPDVAPPDIWLKFLDEVLVHPDSIQLAQEWLGYLLTPDTSQQKILYCEGPRRAGKGTFGRVITSLLGPDSVAGPTLSSLAENFGLEPLLTRPVAIISDARLSGKTDKSVVMERLLSISGEDSQSVNRKHTTFWTGRLSTRFIIMTNETPAFMDGSGALVGRMMGLIFQSSFYGREDTGLTQRLTQPKELSGILNWAIEGYLRLRTRCYFLQPKSSNERLEEMELLGAPIKAFIRDRCVVGPGNEVSTEELFDRWKAWCGANGSSLHVGTKAWFTRNLRMAVPGVDIKRLTSDAIPHYVGVGIAPVGEHRHRTEVEIPF